MGKPSNEPMSTEIVEVTPDMAGDWLALNTHNRPMREQWVQALARRIEAGEWQLNGESIKFSANGALIDGQHRLAAIVMADKAITTVVVHNAPADAFATIDGGRKRNLRDALALQGETGCTALAGIITLHWRWEHRQLVGANISPSTLTGLEHLKKHPGLREATRVADRSKTHAAPSILGCAYYLFQQSDPEAADVFMDSLSEGANLAVNDPIFRLRERFISNRRTRLRLSQAEMLALTIKAWNAWRVGQPVGQLSWRYRGGELFPEVQ